MIYFYPHFNLRDRQLDTIRRWPANEVVNPEVAEYRTGTQVSSSYAKASNMKFSWKSRLPLVNIKLRPSDAPKDSVIYVWGSLIVKGPFIVDIDNPWSLVGYNLRAMPIYRYFIKRILLSRRCREIRCMSKACRESLRELFGVKVYNKARVHYPYMAPLVTSISHSSQENCRFLFIGTQFEIKGGEALLKAFSRVFSKTGNCQLDVITHLPEEFNRLAAECDGIKVHKAQFSREEIHTQFMKNCDVLILPTYVDSFGMVALEALAHGLALITTDVYALCEMTEDGKNGNCLSPPVSIWDGVMPSAAYYDLENIKQRIHSTDVSTFELELEKAMSRFSVNYEWRMEARRASINILKENFSC